MLRSDLCDISNSYIVAKGTITILRPNDAKRNKAVAFMMHHLLIAFQKLMV